MGEGRERGENRRGDRREKREDVMLSWYVWNLEGKERK